MPVQLAVLSASVEVDGRSWSDEKAKPLGLFEWTHKDMKREGTKATGIGSSSGLCGYHMQAVNDCFLVIKRTNCR